MKLLNFNLLKTGYIVLFVFLLAQLFFPTTVGEPIYVDDVEGDGFLNPAENFTSIEDALNYSSSGDLIYVLEGTYVVKDSIVINKSVTIAGAGVNKTLLLIQSTEDISRDCVVEIQASNVTLSGFNIQQYNLTVDGIRVFANNTTISNNSVYGMMIGMYMRNSSYNTIENNFFIQNGVAGIKSYMNTDYNKFLNNSFTENFQNGISLIYDSYSIFQNNYFDGNGFFGANLMYGNNNSFFENTLRNNQFGGLRFSGCSKSFISKNLVSNNSDFGVFLLNCFDNDINNNRIESHVVGINVSSDSNYNLIEDNIFRDNEENICRVTEDSKNNFFVDYLILFPSLTVFLWISFFLSLMLLNMYSFDQNKRDSFFSLLKNVITGKRAFKQEKVKVISRVTTLFCFTAIFFTIVTVIMVFLFPK